jgi:hypothetical protein
MRDFIRKSKLWIAKNILIIIENIPMLLAILASSYVINKNRITPLKPEDQLPWILLVLGLLTVSILIERIGTLRQITNFTRTTYEYLIKKENDPSIDKIIADRRALPPLEERLKSAKEIEIAGGSLSRLASEYLGYFEQKAKDGCKLKLLLLHPESEASKLIAEYVVYEANDYETYRRALLSTLNSFSRLKKQFPDLIEIRPYKCVPPFSLLVCDRTLESGSIMIEIYTHKTPTRNRPQLTLKAIRDPTWYFFFLNQFDLMWNNGETWNEI